MIESLNNKITKNIKFHEPKIKSSFLSYEFNTSLDKYLPKQRNTTSLDCWNKNYKNIEINNSNNNLHAISKDNNNLLPLENNNKMDFLKS